MVNAHLVVGDDGCVLVDAGVPGAERAVERALVEHGLAWSQLRAIIVTHAHVDHAGAAAALRERSGAAIVAHEAERPHLTGAAPMTFCPTGWVGRLFVHGKLIHAPYAPVVADIELVGDARLDLARFGIAGTVCHTAGHTPGSLAVTLATGDALVGDLVSAGVLLGGLVRLGRAKRPPFEDDPQTVATVLERMVADGSETFYLGHGGPIDAREVMRHVRALRGATRGAPHPQRGAFAQAARAPASAARRR